MRRVDDRARRAVLDPDWDERGALLGTLADGDGEQRRRARQLRPPARSRGRGGRVRRRRRVTSGRGIGTRLLEQLAQRAAAVGIERFVAEVMADNRDMLGVFEAVGFELTRELAGGEIEVEFPIARNRGATRRASPSATTSRSTASLGRSSSPRASR